MKITKIRSLTKKEKMKKAIKIGWIIGIISLWIYFLKRKNVK